MLSLQICCDSHTLCQTSASFLSSHTMHRLQEPRHGSNKGEASSSPLNRSTSHIATPTIKRMPSDSKAGTPHCWTRRLVVLASCFQAGSHQETQANAARPGIRENSPNTLIFPAEHCSTFSLTSALTPCPLHTC